LTFTKKTDILFAVMGSTMNEIRRHFEQRRKRLAKIKAEAEKRAEALKGTEKAI